MTDEESVATIDPHYAGFWIRILSNSIDGLLILVIYGVFILADVYIMSGEIGTFEYIQVVNRQNIETKEENYENGSTSVYTKYVETRIDFNGRSAEFEVEQTITKSGNITGEWTVSRLLEAEPGWGGKYALYFDILVIVLLVGYFPVMWSSRLQSTLGGKLVKIRVVDYNGERIGILRALSRAIAIYFLGFLFLMVAFTKKKQGPHDFIAKTLVVRQP